MPPTNITITLHPNPTVAPRYKPDETRQLELVEAVITERGTAAGLPIVDLVLVDADGHRYFAMATGRVFQGLAAYLAAWAAANPPPPDHCATDRGSAGPACRHGVDAMTTARCPTCDREGCPRPAAVAAYQGTTPLANPDDVLAAAIAMIDAEAACLAAAAYGRESRRARRIAERAANKQAFDEMRAYLAGVNQRNHGTPNP